MRVVWWDIRCLKWPFDYERKKFLIQSTFSKDRATLGLGFLLYKKRHWIKFKENIPELRLDKEGELLQWCVADGGGGTFAYTLGTCVWRPDPTPEGVVWVLRLDDASERWRCGGRLDGAPKCTVWGSLVVKDVTTFCQTKR